MTDQKTDSEADNPAKPAKGVTLKGLQGGEPRKAGPVKGVKSLRWDRDPEILLRLETVAMMMVQGATVRMIAAAMGYSPTTAQKDKQRVETLWRREVEEAIDKHRAKSIAELSYIKSQAWATWRELSAVEKKKHLASIMRTIIEADDKINDLLGTKRPSTVNITHLSNPRELSDDELAAIAAGDYPTAGGQ